MSGRKSNSDGLSDPDGDMATWNDLQWLDRRHVMKWDELISEMRCVAVTGGLE